MKKYILLSVLGILALGFLFYFYVHSESRLARNHENVLKLFLTAKHVEATLEKDLLKSRNFLLLSYDSIVTNEDDVRQVCADLRDPEYAIYQVLGTGMDSAVDEYCAAIEAKMDHVERFKSKNAVFRNSLYFLQKMATDSIQAENEGSTFRNKVLRAQLIKAGLAYALVPNDEAKSVLKTKIESANLFLKSVGSGGDLGIILSHATRVFETKDALDEMTNKIVNANSAKLLEQLRESYFQSYTRAEAAATTYRQILFGTCAVSLFLIVFGIVRLWRAALALTEANTMLETRVEERTRDLKASQETITQQQQILVTSSKMSALGEMAGGVAHEINTPLAIITMRAEQMEECVKDGDVDSIDFLDAINVIKQTSDRIAKIVSGLRFFAREGKQAAVQKTAISTLVDETLSFCKERMGNHGVSLEVVNSAGNESLYIECRSVEISQVLLNLLNNSFDAVQTLSEKWIKIGIEDRGEFVELSVTDSGRGIPLEVRERLMQPFFTTKEIGKGTGLGLSISRGIVVSHQGKLSLDTESPNTRFVMLLPKSQTVPVTPAAA